MDFVASPFESLRYSLRQCREQLPDGLATRLHRAISWLHCAEQQQDDVDMAFVSLWIGLNACVGLASSQQAIGERDAFQGFVDKLATHDRERRLYACLWQTYSGPVKGLIKNPYVFHGFWDAQVEHQTQSDVPHWQTAFDQSSVAALNYLSRQQVPELVSIVLDRLWVLQQQIMLGGATYKSSVNRQQVVEGHKLLLSLLPIVIEIMMSAPQEDWGRLAYPVIRDE